VTRAKPRPKASAPTTGARRSWGTTAALLLLRLYAGAFFVDTAIWKLIDYPSSTGYGFTERFERFRVDEYVPMVQGAIDFPPEAFGVPLTAFTWVLREVALPGSSVFAPAVLVGEALLGISLLLGVGVRLSAALGFLMMLAFSLTKFIPGTGGPEHPPFLTVHSVNWALTLILLALSLTAAGRYVGLDAWIRRSGPRWLRWAS
jgi:uncharacterized membrane protein YphA (DoxX/SURF4 family)